MRNFQILFLLPIFFWTISCLNDDSPNDSQSDLSAQTLMNMSYGTHPQEVFDLYLPAGRTSTDTKVIVLIHGGGWTGGDKSEMDFLVAQLKLTHPDYAIANLNYVLANETTYAFPNQFLDVKAVIEKLTNESQTFQINPEFGMAGSSAGAHLAMMYDNLYDQTDQVKFVVDIVGPTNFEDPFYVTSYPIEQIILNLVDPNAYPEGTNFLEALSPIQHVQNQTSPVAMFYGNQDPLIPVANATDYQTKLNQFGITNTLRIYNGGHGNDWSQTDLNEAWQIFGDYIDTYLP